MGLCCFIVYYCSGRFARGSGGPPLAYLRMSYCHTANFFRVYVTGDGSVEDILIAEMKYDGSL